MDLNDCWFANEWPDVGVWMARNPYSRQVWVVPCYRYGPLDLPYSLLNFGYSDSSHSAVHNAMLLLNRGSASGLRTS